MAFDLYVTASGLIIGILFGYILQRGRLCFNSAFRDPLLYKEYSLLQAICFALALSMIGFAVMGFAGIVTLAPKPLIWPDQIVGGFVFGMGMVLAAACASGVTYKTGEGIMTAFMGLLGLSLGGMTANTGWLSVARNAVEADSAFNLGAVTFGGNFNLFLMLGLGVLATIIIVWKWMLPAYAEWKAEGQFSLRTSGWPWFITGIAFAILNMIAWPLSAMAGRNYPLGIVAGWIGVLNGFFAADAEAVVSFGWLSWVVMGLILGSFIGAKIAGEYKIVSPKTGKPILLAFFGGLMLGTGAVFGKGCNIGNLMSGIPQLSAGSWLFSIFLVLGVWFMAYLIFKVLNKAEIFE